MIRPLIYSLLILAPVLASAEEQPNVVFIMADDLGWADVEFHGGNTPTPNLNRLLAEGVEFTQHYVAPVCSPTRAGLLAGRYWSRFGITTPINNRGLPFDTVTVAKALGDAGYSTALIGKWHLGSKPEWGPNHFGFEHSYGSLAGGVTPWNHKYKKGTYSTTWHRNHELITEKGHVTDLLTDEAVRWIKDKTATNDAKPFFLYVPYTAVHIPIREPDEWMEKVPAEIKGEVARQYSACILHLDAAVGRIVDAVDKAGQGENTLVVFTSDNGATTAQNNDRKYPDDNCPSGRVPGNNKPLRGGKTSLYEGGVRVPTIVRWPGKLKAGTKFEPPVCIVDWMPTFCALGGADVDATSLKWDGVDLSPVLTGKSKLEERSIYLTGVRGTRCALQYGDWKLIQSNSKGPVELFNLASDPHETTNVAKANPDKVAELQVRLKEHRMLDVASRGGL
jgi:arylsulfatase A-like enzyme